MNPREQKFREYMQVVAKVFELIEVREHGGANKGEVVEKFLRSQGFAPGNPWCVVFVAWIYEKVCRMLGMTPVIDIAASTSDALRKAKKAGIVIPVHEANTGDAVAFGFGHFGLVIAPPDANGCLLCIEGNTNKAGSAEGDGVYRKLRDPRKVTMSIIRLVPA